MSDTIEPAETNDLSLTDIEEAIALIDHACEQGAFKGWKVIEAAHAIRQRMARFAIAARPTPTPAPSAEDVADAAATDAAATDAAETI